MFVCVFPGQEDRENKAFASDVCLKAESGMQGHKMPSIFTLVYLDVAVQLRWTALLLWSLPLARCVDGGVRGQAVWRLL